MAEQRWSREDVISAALIASLVLVMSLTRYIEAYFTTAGTVRKNLIHKEAEALVNQF